MNKQEELFNSLSNDESLNNLQRYVDNVLEIRGFNGQSVLLKLILISEEVGELAKAIRKEYTNLPIDREKIENYSPVEEELADVFIVLLSLANELDINVYNAFLKKERQNIQRKWNND